MDSLQKLGYLKGLVDGLSLGEDKPENRILLAVVDFLDDFAAEVGEFMQAHASCEREMAELSTEVTDLQEQCEEVQDDVEGICQALDVVIERMGPETMSAIMDRARPSDELYELACPKCGESITVDEETLESGATQCPQCQEKLTFDIHCDCDHDHSEHE